MSFKDITGEKFGKLTVASRAENNIRNDARWNCLCECGKEKIISSASLATGRSNSCGCVQREIFVKMLTTHGRAKSGINYIWSAMLQRCRNPKNKGYKNYGGRGIKVCKRWYKFENFLADMGEKPEGLTLERINNDGDYKPSNCKWATMSEQALNRRNSVKNRC